MAESVISKGKMHGRVILYGIGVVLSSNIVDAVIPLHNAKAYNISIVSYGIANRYTPDTAHAQKCTITQVGLDSFTVRYTNLDEFTTSYQAQYITIVVDLS